MVDIVQSPESQPWKIGGSKIVLVLVGLIGSGKSTFAKALELHVPQFRRCNQDDLGNRRAVENLARGSLREGLSVCIDRTNVDETQRAHWVNIARELRGTQVWCLVFDTPLDICENRLYERTDHPTIKSPEQAIMVLHRFARDLSRPAMEEGFDKIMYLKPEDHSSSAYTQDDIYAILLKIQTSEPPPPSLHQGSTLSNTRQTNLDRFIGPDRRPRGGQRGNAFRSRGFRGRGDAQSSHFRGVAGGPWTSYSDRSNHGFEASSWSPGASEKSGAVPSRNPSENSPQHQINRDPPTDEVNLQCSSFRGEESLEGNAVSDLQKTVEKPESATEGGTEEDPIVVN